MASPFFFVKLPGLLIPERLDYQECISTSPHFGTNRQDQRCQVLYQTRCLMGIYNNVRIKDGDQWKAAFKMNKGLFELTVMFFGMCNPLATFQAMMDSIFQDLADACIMIIYMDDIFLFTRDLQTLEANTKKVLQHLWKNNLYLKPKKCESGKTKIEWLGMIIEEGRISMDLGKLQGIKEWPVLTTMKQVRSFLRFGNFY